MADLFTIEELASYLQRDLDTASGELAREMATALVESYTNRSFTEQTEITAVLRAVGGLIRIPLRPVADVELVRIVDGDRRYPTTWEWDGLHTIHLGETGLVINLPEIDGDSETVEVTWTHGYAAPPADVKAIAVALAGRSYSNPRGLRSEQIGAYSYTAAGGGDDVASVGLLVGEKALLDRYRVAAVTVALT